MEVVVTADDPRTYELGVSFLRVDGTRELLMCMDVGDMHVSRGASMWVGVEGDRG